MIPIPISFVPQRPVPANRRQIIFLTHDRQHRDFFRDLGGNFIKEKDFVAIPKSMVIHDKLHQFIPFPELSSSEFVQYVGRFSAFVDFHCFCVGAGEVYGDTAVEKEGVEVDYSSDSARLGGVAGGPDIGCYAALEQSIDNDMT